MPLTSTVAKQLCTKAELQLFTESLVRNVKNLDLSSVKTRVTRARKLRDKYSGLADKQEREMRGKQLPRRSRVVRGNENTRKKAQLFQEALARFEKHREDLEASSSKAMSSKRQVKSKAVKKTGRKTATKKTAPGRSAKKKKKKSAFKQVAKHSKTAGSSSKARKVSAKAKKSRFVAAGQTRVQKHVSAHNRRQQARRDSR